MQLADRLKLGYRSLLYFFSGIVLFLGVNQQVLSQCELIEREFATGATASALQTGLFSIIRSEVRNPNNAVGDDENFAQLYVNPSALLNQRTAWLRLRLSEIGDLPAHKQTFIQVNTSGLSENLLGLLDGGNTIEIFFRDSDGNQTPATDLKVVFDKDGREFFKAKSSIAYSEVEIRITSGGSLNLLSGPASLDVYKAFYFSDGLSCNEELYTQMGSSGINLDLLGPGPRVVNPSHAINNDPDEYSLLTFGSGVAIGLAATVYQDIFLPLATVPGDQLNVYIRKPPDLVDLGLLNRINLRVYNNGVEIEQYALSSLLDVDLLGLFGDGGMVAIPIGALGAFDQVRLEISKLADVGTFPSGIEFFGIQITPPPPDAFFDNNQVSRTICEGEDGIELSGTAGECIIYTLYGPDEETLIDSNDTGAFDLPTEDLEPGEHTFYMTSSRVTCSTESARTEVNLTVLERPDLTEIEMEAEGHEGVDGDGKYIYIEGSDPLKLSPTYGAGLGEAVFTWFHDILGIIPIEEDDMIDGVSFGIEGLNTLVLTGLQYRDPDEPYIFYLKTTNENGCEAEELYEVNLSSIVSILPEYLQQFTATAHPTDGVELSWRIAEDPGISGFDIQRSSGDLDLETIARVSAQDYITDQVPGHLYTFKDDAPLDGFNYYRLAILGQDMEVLDYSKVIRATYRPVERTDGKLKTYPNPFEGDLWIENSGAAHGDIILELVDVTGKVWMRERKRNDGTFTKIHIQNLDHIPGGIYVLKVYTGKHMQQTRLIKR